MAIAFPGLGSNLDIDSMVESIMSSKMDRLETLKNEKQEVYNKEDVFGDLRTALEELQKASEKLSSPNSLIKKEVNVSNGNVAHITSKGNAITNGTHILEVEQLATSASLSFKPSQAITSPDTVLNTDEDLKSFTYSVNGKTRTVQIPKNMTLTELVSSINNDPDNLGVRAGLIKDGDTYVLRLQSVETGAKNTISVIDNGNGVPILSNAQGTWVEQKGQDALYRIDGYPSTGWIHSSSNSISDAIPDMTVELTGIGSTAITVANNTEDTVKQIEDFIDKTNTVLAMLNDISKSTLYKKENTSDQTPTYNDGYKIGDHTSIFYNNYYVDSIYTQLTKLTTQRLPGYNLFNESTRTGDRFSSLASIGISFDSASGSKTYGQLVIDKERLQEAVEQNPEDVANLLSANGTGKSNSSSFYYYSSISSITQAGDYEVRYSVDANGNVVNATIGGEPATWNKENNTLSVTTGAPQGLVLKVTDLSQKEHTGTVSIQKGLATTLASTIEDMFYTNGSMLKLSESVSKELKTVNKNIEDEMNYLKEYETNLRNRFNAMDLRLAEMNSQLNLMSTFIQAQ